VDEPATDEGGTKACPECAERVQGAARVCRFCGHRFDGAPAPVIPGEASTSGVAIASFLTSLVGLWIAAIPLGVHARRQIDQSNGRKTGRGFATAGLWLGALGLVATIIVIAVVITASSAPTAAQRAEERVQETQHTEYCAEHEYICTYEPQNVEIPAK
jgi:hypothetical protein